MMINSSPSEIYRSGKVSRYIESTVKRDIQIVGKSGLTMLMCTRLIEQLADFTGRIDDRHVAAGSRDRDRSDD